MEDIAEGTEVRHRGFVWWAGVGTGGSSTKRRERHENSQYFRLGERFAVTPQCAACRLGFVIKRFHLSSEERRPIDECGCLENTLPQALLFVMEQLSRPAADHRGRGQFSDICIPAAFAEC